MAWGNPTVLWLLLLPALALLAFRGDGTYRAWPGLQRVAVVGSHVQPVRPGVRRRPWLLLLAFALGVVALARPKWGTLDRTGVEPAREIMIALDLSRSMRVEDVEPSRLDRARALIRSLLDTLEGERVGLVIFAGVSFVQVPLSSDYQIIREFLPMLEPDYLPQGGTDFAGMLRWANDGFSQDKETDRYLFVLSDGESTTEGWRAELANLQARGVQVIALGVGTPTGGEVPTWDGRTAAHSRLESATLQALAAGPGSIYRDASATLDVPALVKESVELGRRMRQAELEKLHEEDQYQWFLALGLICGLGGLWREIGVRPRARSIARHAAAVGAPAPVGIGAAAVPAALAVAALSLGLATANAHQEDADFIGEASAGEQLQWLAHHLAWHPILAIDDLRWMAELTLNYGVETFSKGDAIKEGALRDAIEAVAIGQRLSPTYADWQRLHEELTHLLRRQAATEESKRPPEEAKEARDEEDRSPQTNGQGSQQMAADSIGMGGIAITDATLGELRKEAARLEGPKPPARAMQATPGDLDISDTVASDDPIRALLVKRYHMVTEEDSPGTVHRAMQGGDPNTGPAGGRDW